MGCLPFSKPLFRSINKLLFIAKIQFNRYCWWFFSHLFFCKHLCWVTVADRFLQATIPNQIFQSKNSVYVVSKATEVLLNTDFKRHFFIHWSKNGGHKHWMYTYFWWFIDFRRIVYRGRQARLRPIPHSSIEMWLREKKTIKIYSLWSLL